MPDGEELAELIASLKEAEAEIAAGKCVEHDSATFVQEFLALGAVEASAKAK
ncbi:MAG TPA: hypothetical protein VED87_06675 [Methylocystis sp.]|nr:hypothetical protein [Methylocystis sp.]